MIEPLCGPWTQNVHSACVRIDIDVSVTRGSHIISRPLSKTFTKVRTCLVNQCSAPRPSKTCEKSIGRTVAEMTLRMRKCLVRPPMCVVVDSWSDKLLCRNVRSRLSQCVSQLDALRQRLKVYRRDPLRRQSEECRLDPRSLDLFTKISGKHVINAMNSCGGKNKCGGNNTVGYMTKLVWIASGR
ncbi:hypothetical protein CC79DRAFT_982301 [Sarocladium strictum]